MLCLLRQKWFLCLPSQLPQQQTPDLNTELTPFTLALMSSEVGCLFVAGVWRGPYPVHYSVSDSLSSSHSLDFV